MLVLSDETNNIALSLAERGESGGENGDQKRPRGDSHSSERENKYRKKHHHHKNGEG